MKLIAGSSNIPLAQAIGQHLDLPLADVEISQFPNGEKRVWIKEDIKGHNIVLVQSFSQPTDEHIVEFLLLTDALERMGARHVNLVMPWMGYSLQDKVFREGEPIAAKVMANIISNSYVKRVFVMDLHNSSTPGFFSIPTQHLSALPLYIEYAQNHFDLSNFVVASPDFGGLKRARTLAEKLKLPLVNIDKHRNLNTGETTALGLSGEVEGKSVLIFDDVINSGSTIVTAADILKANGANEIHFCASHGPLIESGFAKIQSSQITSVVVTNSIAHTESCAKVKTIDVSQVFADQIKTWWNPA